MADLYPRISLRIPSVVVPMTALQGSGLPDSTDQRLPVPAPVYAVEFLPALGGERRLLESVVALLADDVQLVVGE